MNVLSYDEVSSRSSHASSLQPLHAGASLAPIAHRLAPRPRGAALGAEGRLLSPIAYASDPIRQAWYIGIFEPWYRRIDNVTFLSRSNRTKMRSRKSSPRTSHDAPTPQHMHHANTSSILNVTASSETAVPRPRSLHSGLSAASALTLLPYRLRLYVPNRIVRLQLQDGSRPRPLPACWSPPLATPWADELRSAGRSPDGPAVGTGRRRARTAMQARPRRASRA
jgi:hypothetical protein